MKITLKSDKQVNRIVSHLPGVRQAVYDKADEIGTRAESRLAGHRRTGRSSIEVEYTRINGLVSLVDPENAMAIEFGHARGNTNVEGLYIITGAAGLT